MALRILVTNDDGIESEGLLWLTESLKRFGDVLVCAPKNQQSGKSQGIDLIYPFEVKKYDLCEGVEAYAVDSTPADCVRMAVLGMHMEFDLVISGINRGLNMGTDMMYSGTVGAACEAVNLGMKAIALSTPPKYYDQAVTQLDRIFEFIENHDLLSLNPIYNINIPEDPKDEIRITHQGGPYYSDTFPCIGNDLYRPTGYPAWKDRGDDTLDTDATLHGYITVTPLTIDKTNWDVYRKLKALSR